MKERQKFLIGERQFCGDSGAAIHLRYYLTEKESLETAGKALYGIRIEKTADGIKEAEQTPALSASRQLVEQLAGRLMAGLVTPVSMIAIVDDLIGQIC